MTGREAIRLLKSIRDLSLLGYPYPDEAPPIDDKLLLCLGSIAGLASKAIGEYEPRIETPLSCP
jgi:hypothetical protein